MALYELYFVSTDQALRHAEQFLFRRKSNSPLVDQDKFRFFYSSNRQPASISDKSLANRFTQERVQGVSYGLFDASIKPSLGLGMLINPTQWLQNEEIQLLNVHTMPEADFTAELRRAVEQSPHQAVMVVLHGFREAHESALRKTAFLGHVLDIDAPMLVFDWPGDQGSSLRGYRRAHRVASESASELSEVLRLLKRDVKPRQIWILANSMGAQVVVKAFSQLYQDREMIEEEPVFKHVILTAPDVDQGEFDARFREELASLSDQLTVYVSSNDRALLASRLINRGARSGESSLSPDMLDEAVRIAELTRTKDGLVSMIDVTPVNRTRNFHNFSLETPEFFDDLFLRLTNPGKPGSRPLYHVQTPDGTEYSVLTQAR